MEKNPRITRLINEISDKTNHGYGQYLKIVEEAIDADKSDEFSNNSQDLTYGLILKLLEGAQKHVYLYTDLPHKNFADKRVLKALREAGNQGVELHMVFRGNLPTDVLIPIEERRLWDDVKYLSKTFKLVHGDRAQKGVGELLVVDDHVRYEVIEGDVERRSHVKCQNENHPERLGRVSIHYAGVDVAIQKIKSFASADAHVVLPQKKVVPPSQGREKE